MKMLKRWISLCLVILLLAGVAFDHTFLLESEVEAAELEETGESAPEEQADRISLMSETDGSQTPAAEQSETEIPTPTPAQDTATETPVPEGETETNTEEETETNTEEETETNTEEETETNTDPETPAPQAAGNEAAVDSLDNANGLSVNARAVNYVNDLSGNRVAYSQLQNSVEQSGQNTITITGWKRSDESKQEYVIRDKKNTGNDDTDWKWSDVSNIRLSITNENEVWDGSRVADNGNISHTNTEYINNSQVTALNGILYDSATWTHKATGYGGNSDTSKSTIHRFQGEFSIGNDDPNNYDYTIKPVTNSNNIYINDNMYVFVYPKSMAGKITDDNYMQYLAFWTGTVAGNSVGDKVDNFHGRENTATAKENSNSGYGVLTDGWYTAAAADNVGGIILSAYNSTGATEYIVDVFAEDVSVAGGMYRLEVEKTNTTRVNGQFRKVDAANINTGVAGARFELVEDSTQRYYTVTSGEDGIVNLRVVPGTYTMREIEAAPGYKLSEKEWTVTVRQRGISISGEQQQEYNEKRLYYITNESDISGNLVFGKVNSDGEPIPGADFELYNKENRLVAKGTSGADGTVTISNIPVGDGYVLKEVSTPSPYILPKETWTVNVAADGTTTLITPEGENPGQIVNYTEQEEAVKNLEKDKTAEAVGDDGRTFKIKLSAQTSGETAGEEAKNASVVLVLDASSSMTEGGKSLKDIKDAAKSFVAELGVTSPKSEVAVIWYKGTEGSYDENIDYTSFQTIENGKGTIDEAIDDGSASGGTPMGAAMEKANEVLKGRSNENKYVLMFTDGMPGYSEGNEPFNCMVANKAYNEAKEIKEYATIYTIGYMLSGSFDWKPGHSGDSQDADDHEGERHGFWPYYYTYNHPTNTTAANFLKDYIATQGSGDQQYAFTTENKDGLKDIFTQLAGEVGTPYSIQPDSIVDVIDARFELTAESEAELKETYGDDISIAPNADGTTTITWSGDSAYIRNETEGGWKAEFQIQAKEDFIGGNMIPTNGAGSGIYIDKDHFTEFPKPTANVKLLNLDLEDKEETFFLGDKITIADLYEKLLETLTMEENQTIPNLSPEETGWDKGVESGGKKVISLDYSYPETSEDIIGTFEFTFEPVDIEPDGTLDGELDDHEAAEVGNNVEQYKLTVTYTSKTVAERQTLINTDKTYKDPVGTELTNGSQDRPIQVSASGIYTIHVIAGTIDIVKKLDAPATESTTYNFKVANGTDEKNVSITIAEGDTVGVLSKEDANALTNLKRGAWTVTETLPDGYAIKTVNVNKSTNCQNDVNPEKTVTFTLGNSIEKQNVIQNGIYNKADGGVLGKVEFTNEKVIPDWQIVKVSTTGNQVTLGGAEFTLVPEEESGTTYYGKSNEQTGVIQWYEKEDFSGDPVDESKLKPGTYTLTETKAPIGYQKNGDGWSVQISENGLKSITNDDEAIQPVTDKGVAVFYFKNEAVYSLPSSGGPGIFLYMIGGTLLLMAGSLMIYINRRRGVLKG